MAGPRIVRCWGAVTISAPNAHHAVPTGITLSLFKSHGMSVLPIPAIEEVNFNLSANASRNNKEIEEESVWTCRVERCVGRCEEVAL